MEYGEISVRHRHGRHPHGDGSSGRFPGPEGPEERHSGRHGHRRHGTFFGGRRERAFDYGELRLLVLAMIAEHSRHGYELMKAIEERMGGSYSPSPGVIYPTLSWLEDMRYAVVETEDAGRKRYA